MRSRYGFDSPRLCNTSRCDPAMRLRRRMSLSRQKLAYVYYENEPGQRSAAKLLTKDEARRIAVNIPSCRSVAAHLAMYTMRSPRASATAWPIGLLPRKTMFK